MAGSLVVEGRDLPRTEAWTLPPPQAEAPPLQAWPAAHMPTGIGRLDDLLGGGLPLGSAVLLYGPPFTGKAQLATQVVAEACRRGVPTTLVLHTMSADAMRGRLAALEPRTRAALDDGTLRFADFFSPIVTGTPAPPVEPLLDRDAAGSPPLLVVESASALLMDAGPARTFHLLRSWLGRTRDRGGVAVVVLESGMHGEPEVQMAKHLCTGMVEFRRKGEAHILHVDGLETRYERPGWIDYAFSPMSFRITGSFASRAIR